jgi:hypothetical protein
MRGGKSQVPTLKSHDCNSRRYRLPEGSSMRSLCVIIILKALWLIKPEGRVADARNQ